ncbi:MAG: glycoside-pentoside-hexuronide (GPH):cation symporter [Lachnospiraceae bacterium]|nr:glycoside-pentoside-hexuronide (GPH):cation symporter [Lachnospiraceae bacterium]
MAKTAAKVKPFGWADKIGYAMGDFGNDFTFILSSSFLLKFYTDVMGVSAFLVGVMMMLARFVDAFTDTAMGQIVDRSEATAGGKFTPWIRRFMGPVAVASFLMYATWFKGMPMGFKIVWMFVTYLLWGSVCYTGVNIPYGSMASAISDNPEDRVQLSSWRNIGATLAGTVIGVVLPLVVYYKDADGLTRLSGTKLSVAALVCSIGAVVCYLLCTSLTTERVKIEKKTEKFSFSALIKQLFSSRALVSIIVAAIVLLLAQLTMQGMNAYIFPNYFNSASGASIAALIGSVLMIILALFVIPPMSKRFGKKEVAIFGNIIAVAGYLAAFLLRTTNMGFYILLYTLGYFGIAFFNTCIWAMITDVIDEDEVRRGSRSDGTIYSLYSFARKIGQALSSGLTGALLTMIGYTDATAFDADVLSGIYTVGTLIPAIGFGLLIIVLLFWYPLGKKQVDANAATLASRKNGKK